MNDHPSPGSLTESIEQRERWLAAVDKVLRGRPFGQVLVSPTRSGLDVQPLYTATTDPVADDSPPGAGTLVRGAIDADRLLHGWDIRQRHGSDDPDALRDDIIEDLEGGVTSIELAAPTGGWSSEGMARALDGVMLGVAPVALAPHTDVDAARALIRLWDRDELGSDVKGSIGLDPLGEPARTGNDSAADGAACASFVLEHLASRPLIHGFMVDVERYVDAGATEVQELAWGTATGVAYLRALGDQGLDVDVDVAARLVGFRWSATSEQFVTIAKLRAARRMWARVLEVSGVAADDRDQYQQAATPLAMYSRRDPWVNLLRATTAALAAVVGGADSITVLPFNQLTGRPDRLGRRTARNTQTLLREESHLGRSVDPAGGSWFVESLTDRLAKAAWSLFQEVDRAGGMAAHVASGAVREQLDDSWAARLAALGNRREALTGVNEFPDTAEPTPPPAEALARLEGGLPICRPAEPFEALRDAADLHLADTGSRPAVHIAAIGDRALFGSRSTWVTNLLGVGGVAVSGGDVDGPESPIAIEAAFVASGATVAVICSTDDLYTVRGASTAMALKEAGAHLVALVGDPGARRSELTAAGVDEFWHDGIDVLDVLRRLHTVLGMDAPTVDA